MAIKFLCFYIAMRIKLIYWSIIKICSMNYLQSNNKFYDNGEHLYCRQQICLIFRVHGHQGMHKSVPWGVTSVVSNCNLQLLAIQFIFMVNYIADDFLHICTTCFRTILYNAKPKLSTNRKLIYSKYSQF